MKSLNILLNVSPSYSKTARVIKNTINFPS